MAKKIEFNKVLKVDHTKAFEIVSNFEKYSEFIPGCKEAILIKKDDCIEIGRLDFEILGKEYFIESENSLTNNSIEIKQLKGPFKDFKGKWVVIKIDEASCHIFLKAEFELPFLLNAITPQSLIDKFSITIINSFINRVL